MENDILHIAIWAAIVWIYSILCLIVFFYEDTVKNMDENSIVNLILYSLITTIIIVLFSLSQCSDNIKLLMNEHNSANNLKNLFGLTFRAFLEVTFISALLYRRGLTRTVEKISKEVRDGWY